MATIIALACLLSVVAAVPLVFIRPSWVCCLFLAHCLFSGILGSYINQAGNLGLPRACIPSDILALLTLLATLQIPAVPRERTTLTRTCLILMTVGAGLCLAQGLFLHFDTALTESRRLHFLVMALFGLRYFTDVPRIQAMIRFSTVCLCVMFVLQILIRFGLYTPPASAGLLTGQLAGESGEMSLAPPAYLGLVALGLARVACGVRSYLMSMVMLATGLGGVALAETRTLAGAVAVMLAASVVLAGGRIRTLVVCILLASAGMWVADQVGFKIGRKFQRKYKESGEYVLDPRQAIDEARMQEYPALAEAYGNEVFFLFTGRGLGARHTNVFLARMPMPEYHSTYLGWLDMFGIIGLAVFLVCHFGCLADGLRLKKSDDPILKSCGAAAAILVPALLAAGVFVPTLLHNRAAPYLILLFVFAANRLVLEASERREESDLLYGMDHQIPVAMEENGSSRWACG
jgi:hypothetical protein